nr:MAG TPA: hypothetical protein [Crassvirales sp.]
MINLKNLTTVSCCKGIIYLFISIIISSYLIYIIIKFSNIIMYVCVYC